MDLCVYVPPRPLQAYLTLGALALVWGSSYILIKRSLLDLTPWEVGHLRLALAGLAFAPVAVRRCRDLTRREWLLLLLIGLAGTGLPSFLFPLAQTEISSSLAAAISSLVPLLTLAVGVVLYGAPLRGAQARGIAVGLAGAVWLVGARYGWGSLVSSPSAGDGAGGWPLAFIAGAVAGSLCYALSSNTVKAFFAETDPLRVTAGAMLPLGVYGLVGLVVLGGLPTGFGDSPTLAVSYAAVVFLGLVGTALASWLFFRLVQLTEPVFASTVSYLVPVVAFGWGLVADEVVTLEMSAALGLVLVGVYLARR